MNKSFSYLIFIYCVSLLVSCRSDSIKEPIRPIQSDKSVNSLPEEALFQYLEPSSTNIDFKNEIFESENFNFLLYEYLYNGGGVAVGDINNDGLDDIYFSGNTVSNKLYLNLGNFKFKDITESAKVNGGSGFKTGVTMSDINNDGLLDIYVCKSALNNDSLRENVLYINNGDLTFRESSKEFGLNDKGFSVQAYFFDADGDNDMDVFILNHSNNMKEANKLKVTQNASGEIVIAKPREFTNLSDRFYENIKGRFEDKSKEAGILNDAFGLSAVVGDFNDDFKPDIYVCNDYAMPDRLLINQGQNKFKDEIDKYFSHTSFSSMGSDYADVNNDSHMDLLTLDMSPRKNDRRKMMMMAQNYDKFQKMTTYGFGTQYSANAFQINSGKGFYSDIAFLDKIAQTEWSWSALFADFNNDGLKDVHVTNGYKRDVTNNDYSRYRMDLLQKKLSTKEITLKQWIEEIPSVPVTSFLFKNESNLRFKDVSNIWDSGTPAFSNGAAYTDLDNDGYLDLVVNNINDYPFIMKNNGVLMENNDYLTVRFKHQSNKIFLGAKAMVTLSDGTVLTDEYNPTRGFLSSSQHKLHFGIKKGLTIDNLTIIWPDKKKQVIQRPISNQVISISYKPDSVHKPQESEPQYLEDVSELLSIDFFHEENDYIDFKREVLLHHKYSEEGPAVAIGDINNDGFEDVFLGGAKGYAPKLFIQDSSLGFKLQRVPDFELDKSHEDTDAVFFDANSDGFLDLYVVSGGNEEKANNRNYNDRLYVNDGKGNFKRDKNALPEIFISGSVVKINDVDNDGQPDIFIGSRITPGRYPEIPKSYFLKNQNGVFKDYTDKWLEGSSFLGMITDAEFEDLDNDGTNELIIAGEWMPISVLKQHNGIYKNKSKDFGTSTKLGWWSSISVEDIDGNGFKDIVAGNLGLNSIFKASEKEPTTLFYKDFDNNGSIDPVLCTYIDGVSYPIHNRDRILDHMVMLKKRFIRYKPYSYATITDMFTPQELKGVNQLKANHFEHSVLYNVEGKKFNYESLPIQSQISVVNDAVIMDINSDGKKDIITGGNFFGTDAEFGRYDASYGTTFINSSSGFTSLNSSESGLFIPGNVQHIKPISVLGTTHLLVIRNSDKASLIKLKSGL